MSGTSDTINCPNCGASGCYRYEGDKFPTLNVSCLECGFYVTTVISYLNLEQLNEQRESNDMEILSELPTQNLYA